MALSFDEIRERSGKTRWISLPEPLDGIDLEVKHASPAEIENFRQMLLRRKIMKHYRHGIDLAPGKMPEWAQAMTSHYIVNWRGDIKDPDHPGDGVPPYDSEKLGAVLAQCRVVLDFISEEIEDESAFFSKSKPGSKP